MVSRADGVLFQVWSRKVRVEKEQREAHALPDRGESYGRQKKREQMGSMVRSTDDFDEGSLHFCSGRLGNPDKRDLGT